MRLIRLIGPIGLIGLIGPIGLIGLIGPIGPISPSLFKCKNSRFGADWQIFSPFVCVFTENV